MKSFFHPTTSLILLTCCIASAPATAEYVAEAGHSSLQVWVLGKPAEPADNKSTTARVELGKALFFDPRLSGDGNMSCATCHNPMLGWSDGLPTARGFRGQILDRATPTILNSAYNHLQMWDGRAASLEEQATGPLDAEVEMAINVDDLVLWLRSEPAYAAAFEAAYPGEPIGADTLSKAIAAFERTIVSRNTPFGRWVAGDETAMSTSAVSGFQLFVDSEKGNCVVCHSPPNFTDSGFHNVGLSSFNAGQGDLGRYHERPLNLMRGAFKTPSLRDVTKTAPYFHDGSALTLREVMQHYVTAGIDDTNLSPSMKPLDLTDTEISDLVAFLEALTSPPQAFTLPSLPTATEPSVAWEIWDPEESATQIAAK